MSLPHEDLNTTPIAHARFTIPDDIPAGSDSVAVLGKGPSDVYPKAVRWLGSGPATFYYRPLIPRADYNATELSGLKADARAGEGTVRYLPASFSDTYEERAISFSRIHKDATAGVWEVTY